MAHRSLCSCRSNTGHVYNFAKMCTFSCSKTCKPQWRIKEWCKCRNRTIPTLLTKATTSKACNGSRRGYSFRNGEKKIGSRRKASQILAETTTMPEIEESSPVDKDQLSVSVIIPVYNEVSTIATLVERVGDVMCRIGGPYEIICVDDGSTDGKIAFCPASRETSTF